MTPAFLTAALFRMSFKGPDTRCAMAWFLARGLAGGRFSGADLPREIAGGDVHVAGIACGALAAQRLVEVCDRIRSPRPEAKGRMVNVYQIPDDRRETARTWLRRNGVELPTAQPAQQELALA